jgi:hypothetical protein
VQKTRKIQYPTCPITSGLFGDLPRGTPRSRRSSPTWHEPELQVFTNISCFPEILILTFSPHSSSYLGIHFILQPKSFFLMQTLFWSFEFIVSIQNGQRRKNIFVGWVCIQYTTASRDHLLLKFISSYRRTIILWNSDPLDIFQPMQWQMTVGQI